MPKTTKKAEVKPFVRFDYSRMTAERGNMMMPKADLIDLARRLEPVRAAVIKQWRSGQLGFMAIPERTADLKAVEAMAKTVGREFKTLVVIGIGGSDLGARMLVKALKPAGKGMEIRFIGANTDPDEMAALLRDLDWRKTAINVISKSGDTIEPMSAFVLLRDRLVKAVGVNRHARHVIATTDTEKGTLRKIADREGYRTLPVPADIGGRFSVLTPVGLFPAACAGIPVRRLVVGCRAVRDEFAAAKTMDNGPLMFAGLQHDGYVRRSQHITVLMPYGERLREFGSWFRQLWAESLGKRLDRHGKVVNHGFTPVAALGATDQHSQVQLYNEGPFDKTLTFIEVESPDADFRLPNPYPDIEGTAYMAGHRLGEILHAERAATSLALTENGRPNGTVFVPRVSPEAVGALVNFFQIATAVAGELLDVNAYDQPGVEAGKKHMYKLLGRKGFEKF
ncbi:MAG: glucose-6-phosphate isomerase [Patescibacteria group bacterium]|nr:glucose-6-phosphate isomerase [Patescibacteria group bacterium]